jgi:hypothetical protein
LKNKKIFNFSFKSADIYYPIGALKIKKLNNLVCYGKQILAGRSKNLSKNET